MSTTLIPGQRIILNDLSRYSAGAKGFFISYKTVGTVPEDVLHATVRIDGREHDDSYMAEKVEPYYEPGEFKVGDRVILDTPGNHSWNAAYGTVVSTPRDQREIGTTEDLVSKNTNDYIYVCFEHIPHQNSLYGDGIRKQDTIICSVVEQTLRHFGPKPTPEKERPTSSLKRFIIHGLQGT
jgi:hypothetical protein